MKILPSQSILQQALDYDPLTGILTWKARPITWFTSERLCRSWNTKYEGKEAFTAVDKKGYRVGSLFNVPCRAARVIWKLTHGVDPVQIDHEDGNRQNNRLLNLRDVSGQTNQQNMKRASNNTSGTTGVSWNTSKNRWEAKIKVNGKTKHLGRFPNINDAITARKQGELKYGFHPNHGR